MPIKREWLEEALKEDETCRKIIRLDEVSLPELASAIGENFTSVVNRLQVDVVLESGKAHKMSLIVKEYPREGEMLEFLESEAFIDTEKRAYKEILPLMKSVLEEIGERPLWPICFGMKENYVILSDLRGKGYVSKDPKARLDLDHALVVVKGLALFHAASVVLHQRGKLDATGLRAPFISRSTPGLKKYREGAIIAGSKTMLSSWGPEWNDIALRIQKKSFNEELEKIAEIDERRLNVLCHGDPWTTNIFFRYCKGEKPKPVAVRFVDYQLITYNSYAFDLVFFIGTSIPPELRRRSKNVILEHYTESLSHYLGLYGLSDLAPSLEDVQKEMKRLDPYLFFVIFSEQAIQSSDLEDPFILEKLISKDDDPAQNPKIFEGNFKYQVDEELRQWAQENWF